LAGSALSGPCFWRKISDLLNGTVGKSWQDLVQVFADRDPEAAATFDYGEDRGHTRPGLFTSDVDPVFSTQGDSPDILPMSVMN
jgi:hypothetical protein